MGRETFTSQEDEQSPGWDQQYTCWYPNGLRSEVDVFLEILFRDNSLMAFDKTQQFERKKNSTKSGHEQTV